MIVMIIMIIIRTWSIENSVSWTETTVSETSCDPEIHWQVVMSVGGLSGPKLNNYGITSMFVWLFTLGQVSPSPLTATRAISADHLWTRVNVDPALSKHHSAASSGNQSDSHWMQQQQYDQ